MDPNATSIPFILNDRSITVSADPATPLVDVLRDDLGLTGTKRGCDYEGECGACTVLLNDQPVRSCLTPVGKVAGQRLLTIEGLGRPDHLHPLQQAFIEVGAVQCGYCTPGMLLAAKALLDREPDPTQDQIVDALAGNLCRCTGYTRILTAVRIAAARIRGEDDVLPASSDEPLVGGDALRTDSLPKVTGQAEYVEDIAVPGLLHASVLRSPHHHARLVSLDVAPAAEMPGVVRVLTAADVPGENGLSEYSRDEPLLAPVGDTLKMMGAPVALVIARTPEQARAALAAIEVQYQPLPHTLDAEEALRPGALPIYDGGNILATNRVARGDLEGAFSASDTIVETCYRTTYQEHATLEREAALGYIGEDGRITVISGTHEPHWQQNFIASALALDPDQVRVIMPPTGGSFGGRQDPWPLVAAALMTYWVRQPVRLAYSRQESFCATPKRHPFHVDYQIGATRDGHLTGIHVRIYANTGGYDAHGRYISNFALVASGGPYRWRAVDGCAHGVYTNGPKCGQFRGFGTPQSTFALECTLDELAEMLGQDPLAFRLKNALQQSDVSFLGYPAGESLGYVQVLETIRPRYEALLAEAAAANAPQGSEDNTALRRGVGLAGMWYRFGKSGSLQIEAHAEMMIDGHFVVYCSAPDYGQGTNTVMSQLAAETLGTSRRYVAVVNADTALTPDSGIQGASRATYFVGGAVRRAAENLKHVIQATAAELLDRPPSDLEIQGDCVVSSSKPSVSLQLQSIAEEMDRLGQPRKVIGLFDLSPYFPEKTRPAYAPLFITAAHVAEVEVDMRTGVVRVTRVVAAHDVGRVINPIDARGQIEGAVLMGLGTVLMEEYLPGQTTGFGNYYLPTMKSMPEIEVLLVEVASYHGPLGVKGLAEAAILPSTPAIVNAISRAIGARIRQLPATPERVLGALHADEARRP